MPPVLKYLLLWTVICCSSAAPSFFVACSEYKRSDQILAMLAGIGCFIVVYTAVSCTELAARFRRQPFVLTTMGIG